MVLHIMILYSLGEFVVVPQEMAELYLLVPKIAFIWHSRAQECLELE